MSIISQFFKKDLLVAALFVMAPNWKQNKYPSTDEEINKLVYLYTGILLTNKTNELLLSSGQFCHSVMSQLFANP